MELQIIGMDGKTLQLKQPNWRDEGGKKMLFSENQAAVDLTHYFRAFEKLSNTFYIPAFRNALNVNATASHFDIAIGINVINLWRNLKTGPATSHNELVYKLIDDIRRIFRYDQLDINPSSDGTTFQFIINGLSYTLFDQGSGIAQFVLVLTNLALREPSFVLIDEPELNLHPSLQLEFLATLHSYATEGVLFATHSYGLARASASAIYTIHHDPVSGSEVALLEATTRLSELLGELSFSGYRDLGFDKILLVEGPTDILTVREWLRLYRRDHKIVLLPLGGSSMINGSRGQELEEVKRISENLYALIDSERETPGEELPEHIAEFERVCKSAKLKECHVLERRAIENYFPDTAVKGEFGAKYKALGAYDKLTKAAVGWDKADNWRIARRMTLDDLRGNDLGDFLKRL